MAPERCRRGRGLNGICTVPSVQLRSTLGATCLSPVFGVSFGRAQRARLCRASSCAGAGNRPSVPTSVGDERRCLLRITTEPTAAETAAVMLDEAEREEKETGKKKKEVFIAMEVTLQEIDNAKQTFMVTGYVNAMWRCPDLEHEKERQDYYSPGHAASSVKEGLEEEAKLTPTLSAEENQARKGGKYVRKSTAASGLIRHYVTDFDLRCVVVRCAARAAAGADGCARSHESDVLPFNPKKMFEDRRIIPESFELEETRYYYYPEEHNRVDQVSGPELARQSTQNRADALPQNAEGEFLVRASSAGARLRLTFAPREAAPVPACGSPLPRLLAL